MRAQVLTVEGSAAEQVRDLPQGEQALAGAGGCSGLPGRKYAARCK